MDIITRLAKEFNLNITQVQNTVKLLDEDNTVPFIARYRKELTGSLDDQVLRELNERLIYLRNLDKRKEEILSSIESQGKLTDEIKEAVNNAMTLAEVEDIYRPYKPKRKTRGSVAREKGLEGLAAAILLQKDDTDIDSLAEEYLNEQVENIPDAIAGACDIIAEDISDMADIRKSLRSLFIQKGVLTAKAQDSNKETVYDMYYDYSEPLKNIAGHRILAIDRGEHEDALKVSIEIPKEDALSIVTKNIVKATNPSSELVKASCEDSLARLIFPSLEREMRSFLTQKACDSSIKVFSANLSKLLMAPPVKGSVTLGLDPAYRTGCKIAVVDDTGKVLDTTVIYPTPPQNKIAQANEVILKLIKKHGVTTIAIGNGTASRESEKFIADLIREYNLSDVSYMIVSEAGASVYSASKLAAKEFPQFDVSLRSAVSIARRLQDPLSELVKIDPKAIGVGQYQHDMPKKQLDDALNGVVESCVNSVGVDLNTASNELLSKIAGINSTVAQNIITYREENGAFKNRKELLKVPKLGQKAFTQSAGFLRVSGGENFLDNTGVHPESYDAAKKLLKILDYSKQEILESKFTDIKERIKTVNIDKICDETNVGKITINDIVTELAKPGRDPRDELPKPILRSDVLELKDLKEGMQLKGTVRNVIDFGAFIDIGVHEDGLCHISQICDRYIKHPLEVLNVGDIVDVWVLNVDQHKKRISLTMKKPK